LNAFIGSKKLIFLRASAYRDDEIVEEPYAPLDNIQMTVCNGIERAGENRTNKFIATHLYLAFKSYYTEMDGKVNDRTAPEALLCSAAAGQGLWAHLINIRQGVFGLLDAGLRIEIKVCLYDIAKPMKHFTAFGCGFKAYNLKTEA
jgi:hypothetical protein